MKTKMALYPELSCCIMVLYSITRRNCYLTIPDQSGHHFALWMMGRSDRFNIGLTHNDRSKGICSHRNSN